MLGFAPLSPRIAPPRCCGTVRTPLLGAGVLVQGTTTGTVTDLDGLFELNVPAGAILEVSSIGYKTVTLPVGNQTKFEITL